jgi:serine/threonine-protein kinase RsbW
MRHEATLTVPCRLDQLAVVAAAARRLAEPAVGAAAAALVDLAVTELCSNVVRHGRHDGADHHFTVRFVAAPDAIEIEIRDVGPAFAAGPATMPSVDVAVEDLPEGGFGMALVQRTMDAVEYRREGDTNVTRIAKRRP